MSKFILQAIAISILVYACRLRQSFPTAAERYSGLDSAFNIALFKDSLLAKSNKSLLGNYSYAISQGYAYAHLELKKNGHFTERYTTDIAVWPLLIKLATLHGKWKFEDNKLKIRYRYYRIWNEMYVFSTNHCCFLLPVNKADTFCMFLAKRKMELKEFMADTFNIKHNFREFPYLGNNYYFRWMGNH